VSLDHLWAGWRASYVGSFGDGAPVSTSSGRGADGVPETTTSDGLTDAAPSLSERPCVFCEVFASAASDEERLIVWSGETVVALLNAYPYASGHVMVMPWRHARELEDLSEPEAAEVWQAVRAGVSAVKTAYRPDGINLGVNLGRAAGAGIPAHLHVHVVPRWLGDTNFMTSVASVRVLPEPLPESWQRLHAAWR
jgi:ATP adenylyltransferase